jgi:protein-disulfide isomerase
MAAGLGVSSLPIVFINGRPISGAYPLGTFVTVLEEEFERASTLSEKGVEASKLYAALVADGETRGAPMQPGGDQSFVPQIDETKAYSVGLGIESHRRGPADALVTVVEFSDFRCGYCARAHATVDKLAASYDDLRIVYRHIPQLGEDDQARMIAEAAVAAGEQGKFWSYHDLLFAAGSKLDRAELEGLAKQTGLDIEQFRAALDDRRHLPAVIGDIAAGRALGVQGTPTFYINGRPLIGSQPLDVFKAAIDAARADAEALVAAGVPRAKVYEESIRRKLTTATEAIVPAEKVEVDPVDYHIAVLMACRAGDGEQAKELFESVKNKQRRRLIRKDCKRLGIELPR